MTTMRDVAARAGVSAKTVSRVLNGHRYVSSDVRQRVEQAIVELRYVPNMLAQSFRHGRDAAIGVAVPDIADPFFADLTRGIERLAKARGVAVIVTSLGEDSELERQAVEALLRRQVAGMVIAPVGRRQSYLEPWLERAALVFVDRPPRGLRADCVIEDDVGGSAEAVRHLLARGHRRIAFLGDKADVVTTARRLDGYRVALDDAGFHSSPDLIRMYRDRDEEPAAALRDLLAVDDPPTALLSSNSRCSVAVVPQLQAMGRTDLALVSFGDFPMAAALRPSVTVVDQNPAELGRVAAQRLFDRVDQPHRRLRRQLVLPVRLIERESSDQRGPSVVSSELGNTG